MYTEIQDAVAFLISYLNELPNRKVHSLSEQLGNFLLLRFEGHWDPSEPMKDRLYRAVTIRLYKDQADPMISAACIAIGLELKDVLSLWPPELTVWINPGSVTACIGTLGTPFVVPKADVSPQTPFRLILKPESRATSQWSADPQKSNERLVFEASSPYDYSFNAGSFVRTRFGSAKYKTEYPKSIQIAAAAAARRRSQRGSNGQGRLPYTNQFSAGSQQQNAYGCPIHHPNGAQGPARGQTAHGSGHSDPRYFPFAMASVQYPMSGEQNRFE